MAGRWKARLEYREAEACIGFAWCYAINWICSLAACVCRGDLLGACASEVIPWGHAMVVYRRMVSADDSPCCILLGSDVCRMVCIRCLENRYEKNGIMDYVLRMGKLSDTDGFFY